MSRESFVVYKSFYHLIKLLKQKDQIKMYEAIFEYGLEGVIPTFDNPSSEAVWQGIFPQLKANQKRYENGLKGAESGVLGGRPRNNPTVDKEETPNENDEESNQDIKNNTYGIATYDEIVADMEFSKPVELKVKEFIKHCVINGHKLINSDLESILVQLDLQYDTDELKIQALNDAIQFGFYKLKGRVVS
jgi:hypothetical protein